MKYRIKIIELKKGTIIYYPQYAQYDWDVFFIHPIVWIFFFIFVPIVLFDKWHDIYYQVNGRHIHCSVQFFSESKIGCNTEEQAQLVIAAHRKQINNEKRWDIRYKEKEDGEKPVKKSYINLDT